MHSTATTDFSLGGNLGFETIPVVTGTGPGAMVDRHADVFVEPAFQIRLFIATNVVALSFTGGLELALGDASGTALTAQGVGSSLSVNGNSNAIALSGGAGIHYYFF